MSGKGKSVSFKRFGLKVVLWSRGVGPAVPRSPGPVVHSKRNSARSLPRAGSFAAQARPPRRQAQQDKVHRAEDSQEPHEEEEEAGSPVLLFHECLFQRRQQEQTEID